MACLINRLLRTITTNGILRGRPLQGLAMEEREKKSFKDMTEAEQDEFLAKAMSPLPIERAVPQVVKKKDGRVDEDAVQRHWMSVMHLMGASFGQIAGVLGVRQQTVMSRVSKLLPVTTRAQSRLYKAMKIEELSWFTEQYREHIVDGITLRPPIQIAQWLMQNFPYQPGE